MAPRVAVWLTRPPIRFLPLRPLLIPLPILFLVTILAYSLWTDLEVPMLYSQCRSHALLPNISKPVPFFGPLLCFGISFYEATLDSIRGRALMAVCLAFFGALLTVTHVEAARITSKDNRLLGLLWLMWFFVQIGGGPAIFQLLIVSAFLFQMGREVRSIRQRTVGLEVGGGENGGGEGAAEVQLPPRTSEQIKKDLMRRRRLITDADALAIPDAILLGFALPAVLMLIYNTPATIFVWLLFPVWVPILRVLFRTLVHLVQPYLAKRGDDDQQQEQEEGAGNARRTRRTLDLESSPLALLLVYIAPVLFSVAAHAFWIYSLTHRDQGRKVTHACVRFVLLDVGLIALTTLYWFVVEAGWAVCLAVVGCSLLLGPGAGVCIGWVLREYVIRRHHEKDAKKVGRRSSRRHTEETPLLR